MRAIDRLREWAKQGPTFRVTADESLFLAQVELYASRGVGYGWMQQVVEWEWQDKCERDGPSGGARGPEYFNRRIAELETANAELVAAAEAWLNYLGTPSDTLYSEQETNLIAALRAALSRVTPTPEG